jgi:deoxycytidylate deaminase
MSVKIHGKEYTTVAERISLFRAKHPNYSLESEVQSAAELVQVKAVIKNEEGRVLATGHAEEVRGATNINKTSALENCETSAWGRALAALDFGGDQVASANEVSDAIIKQNVMEATDRLIKHNEAVRDNIDSIVAVKTALLNGEFDTAAECMRELSDEVRMALGLASTKGGIFTIAETKLFQSQEYKEATARYFEDK